MKKENNGSILNKSSSLHLLISLWFYFLCISTVFIARKVNQTIVDQNKREAEQIAESLFVSQVRLIEDSKLIFNYWANEIKESPKLAQDPCQADVIKYIKEDTTYLYYGASDSKGLLVCAWVPVPEGASIKDRKYFKDVLATKKLSIGEYQEGAITGSPSINLGYPVTDGEGEVKFVILLALNLDWLDQRISDLHLPKGTELLIADYKGKILATYPTSEDRGKVTTDINPRLFSTVLSKNSGVIEGKEIGEKEKIYAFRVFGDMDEKQTNFYSIVSVPEKVTSKELCAVTTLAYLIGVTFLFSGIISSGLFLRESRSKKNNV